MYKKLSHFFWFIIKPYRWHVAGVYATAFLNAVSLSASPYLLKIIIDAVSTNTGTKLEIFKTLTWPVLGYLLAHVLTACNYRFNDWLILKLFPNCKQGIITHMYAYLNKHSYQYFQNSFAGSLLNKILDMVGSFPPVLRKLDLFFGLFCLVLIANFILFQVHPIFAMILFTWTLAFLGLSASFTKKIKALSHDFSSLKTKTSGYIVDSISNMLNVRLFASERFESERIGAALLDTVQADRSLQRAILKMRILQDLGIIGLMAAMLYGLLYFYGLGKITAGDFALVLSISATVFQWVWYLASEFVFFAEDLGKCAQALSIISAPHAIRDREPPKLLEIKSGKIEFKDLKFGYESKGPLFEKFNVILKAGEKTGLVGSFW
ncbi:MAG: ABC transporter transmembrane domain-containing protein [Gammaproteobacteria bacterium]